MTARRALETLGAMKLTKVRLKEGIPETDRRSPEIVEIFKALRRQMTPRIQVASAE